LAGLRIAPYIASKFSVLAVLSLIQTASLLVILGTKVTFPSSGALVWGPLELWITLSLTALAAVGLGLLISASMANGDRAQSLVPILLIPQVLFVGGHGSGTISTWLSYLTITHWATQAMQVTAHIPYKADGGGVGAGALLMCWGMLLGMTSVFVAAAAFQLSRKSL